MLLVCIFRGWLMGLKCMVLCSRLFIVCLNMFG